MNKEQFNQLYVLADIERRIIIQRTSLEETRPSFKFRFLEKKGGVVNSLAMVPFKEISFVFAILSLPVFCAVKEVLFVIHLSEWSFNTSDWRVTADCG